MKSRMCLPAQCLAHGCLALAAAWLGEGGAAADGPSCALNDLLLSASLPGSLEGLLRTVHKPHHYLGMLRHLGSRHVSKAFESGRVWNVSTWHQASPLTFDNTPLTSKGASQDVVSQLRSFTTFHHILLVLVQRKQILNKECAFFFPLPVHQIISTRAIYNLNCPPYFYIRGSGWILVKPIRNLPLKKSDSDLPCAFLCAQINESCSWICFFLHNAYKTWL